MPKYIDIEKLQFEPDPWGGMNGVLFVGRSAGKTIELVKAALKRMIQNAPTVDAVEVVRCKNCDFCYHNSSNGTFRCTTHNGMNRTVEPDEFCSYGERREGE